MTSCNSIRICQTRRVIDVFAHRGLHVIERENTLGRFGRPSASGSTASNSTFGEPDDGVLVVHHDAIARRLVIAQTSRSALPDYVPTLEEALSRLEGVAVNVEIKNGRGVGRASTTTPANLPAKSSRPSTSAGWTRPGQHLVLRSGDVRARAVARIATSSWRGSCGTWRSATRWSRRTCSGSTR